MRLVHAGIALILAAGCFADTITLRSGRVLNGTYLGGNARQVRLDTGDQIQTLDVSDISRIEFTASAPAAAPAPPPPPPAQVDAAPPPPPAYTDRPPVRRSDESVMRPDPPPDPAPTARRSSNGQIELPAGANLVIRMIDGVDSENNSVGQTFAASLDEAVTIGNETIIPRGADAVVKLVDSKDSGKFTGRAELTLALVSLKVNGRPVDINTQTLSRESDSRGAQTAKTAGGTAVVGAIIGAIAGGGKGAAIGAAAGGAAGAGAQVVLKGQRVKIPSETRLTFVLDSPVRI